MRNAETRLQPDSQQAQRRPRVAMVVHDIGDGGGMERVHAEILRRAAPLIDFIVLSSTLSAELRPLVEWHPIRVLRRPIPLKFMLFYLRASLQLFRLRPAFVHTAGALVATRADLITVHFCHAGFRELTGSVAAPSESWMRRLNATIGGALALLAERWGFRAGRVRTLAAVSSAVGRQLARHYPTVPRVVIPNGVDLERFAPDPSVRRQVRHEAHLSDEDILILFVGGFWRLKGLDILIRAVAQAQAHAARPFVLLVAGAGRPGPYLELARQAGIAATVRFAGVHTAIERFDQAADLFVLPSLYETFSLAAFEAAACGVPVIGTRVGGIEELVGANEAGRLVERRVDDVARAIIELAADAALRRRLGATGRQRAREYTWDRAVDAMLRLYQAAPGSDFAPVGEVAPG